MPVVHAGSDAVFFFFLSGADEPLMTLLFFKWWGLEDRHYLDSPVRFHSVMERHRNVSLLYRYYGGFWGLLQK